MNKILSYSSAIWRIWLQYRQGFNPVEIVTYQSYDYADCFDHIESRQYPINKKCHVFVRQIGTKYKHFHFDEKFYAELLANELTDSDRYYDEKSIDDRAYVDFRRKRIKPAIWRGIRRL